MRYNAVIGSGAGALASHPLDRHPRLSFRERPKNKKRRNEIIAAALLKWSICLALLGGGALGGDGLAFLLVGRAGLGVLLRGLLVHGLRGFVAHNNLFFDLSLTHRRNVSFSESGRDLGGAGPAESNRKRAG